MVRTRYILAGMPWLVTLLALAGCFAGKESGMAKQAPAAPAREDTPLGGDFEGQNRGIGDVQEGRESDDSRLRHGIVRALDELLGSDRSIEEEEYDELRQSLREADTMLEEIKRENREAMSSLRQSPLQRPGSQEKPQK